MVLVVYERKCNSFSHTNNKTSYKCMKYRTIIFSLRELDGASGVFTGGSPIDTYIAEFFFFKITIVLLGSYRE